MPFGCFGPDVSASKQEKERLQLELDQAKAALAAQRREAAELKSRHEDAIQQQIKPEALKAAEEKAESLRLEVEKLTKDLEAVQLEASGARDQLKVAKDEADSTKQQLETERASARQTLEEVEAKATTAEARATAAETRAAEADNRTTEAEARATAAEAKVDAAEARATEAEARATAAEAKVDAAEARATEAEASVTAAEAKVDAAEARATEAEARATAAEAKVDAAEARATEAEARATAAAAKVDAAESKAAEYATQVQEASTRIDILTRDLAAAHDDAATAHTAAAAAQEEAKRLNEQLAAALEQHSKAIAEAELRATAAAQEAAAAVTAVASEQTKDAATASRQQLEALQTELAALQARLQAAEKDAKEGAALRQQLSSALAEVTSLKELRRDLSERLSDSQAELENANLVRQSLDLERQLLGEQLEQLAADRGRLEMQVSDLEADLLAAAISADRPLLEAEEDVKARGKAGNGGVQQQTAEQLEALGVKALAAQLLAARQEAVDLRKELERTIVGHVEEEEKLQAENEELKGTIDELTTAVEAAEARIKDMQMAMVRLALLVAGMDRIIGNHWLKQGETALLRPCHPFKPWYAMFVQSGEAVPPPLPPPRLFLPSTRSQTLKEQLSAQLGNTQYALDEARGIIETLRLELRALQQEREALQGAQAAARAEVEAAHQQLHEAQRRNVELTAAAADRSVELARLRSEVASHGALSDSNTEMTARLLSDYQALQVEASRLRGELRNKDEVMALLQEQLSSLTEIDLDAMVKQIDSVQPRKPAKKQMPAAAPLEAMMAAAGLSKGAAGAGGSGAGQASPAKSSLVSSNGAAAEVARGSDAA
ncbi:hypothetical protein Agub_g5078 [Astrephomene gubernaculifera]|uniref:Uncharacterized protein n=1 Tax=Astrephomene gubernaculifera TaxID=47775 RepID=A0AAD3HJT2_9CHLO|nr:hypothetical protein Agub_g5078 [Astrephomene gubernaculifera]